MITVAELQAESKKLYAEYREILTNPKTTADDLTKADRVRAAAEDYKARAVKLDEIDKSLAAMEVAGLAKKDEPGDTPVIKKWRSAGEFYLKVFNAATSTSAPDARLQFLKDDAPKTHESKDMAESVGATGGYLVPTEYRPDLMAVAVNSGIVRSGATVIPMRRRQIDIPVLDQTGTTANQPHWFGGLQAYWQEEASLKTQSDARFRMISLVANKLVGYTRVSDELLDDSAIALETFLNGEMGFSGAIKWMEDYAFLRGTGVGQPLGILNSAATISVPRAQQSTVTYEDLINMLENFMPGGSGTWVASQNMMSNLMLMNGPTGNPAYLWGSAANGVPNSLLGYPIKFTEKMPRVTTTSSGDIGLFDFKYYIIGDRQQVTVESTKFDRWQYDQTSWRAVARVDGQPWLSSPVTFEDGSTQISPFVILSAKST